VATVGRLRSTRLLVFGLLLASLVTITIDARGGERGPLAAVSRVLGGVIGPLQEGVSAVFRPIGSFFSNVFQAGSLAERVEELETENAKLRTDAQGQSEVLSELKEYEGILEIAADEELDVMGASVIGESPNNFEWAVYVDRGSQDGVEIDMPVIGPSGLVGRVSDVYATTSKVMLIIDPDSKVAARLSSSRETGLIEGQREEPLRFSLFSPEAEILAGEPVETAGYQLYEGYSGIFPSGIPIGVVDRVEPADDGVTVSVTVRPNMRFSQLDKLGLVTGVPNLAQEIEG
jgi:rod shape-determining protein MreC